MGKKRISALGSEDEASKKAKREIQLEQKRLREGKELKAKAPGLKGGQRVVDTAAESLIEYDQLQEKLHTEEVNEVKKTKVVRIRSSAYKTAKAKIDPEKTYPIKAALEVLKQVNLTKFDPTVELHMNLGKSGFSQNIELPYSNGKSQKIAVADDVTVAKIEANQIDFDVLLASPAQMPKLVKLAKILGPKGLMPNPKNGTVVTDPEVAAKKLVGSNSLALKTEKSAPLIHAVVGKLSQPEKELTANIEAVFKSLSLSQNSVLKAVLKTTMSPAVKLML